ncbi:MAG: hypothetical protein HY942_01640 [Gammaproteobacteria bacterium]|nr:hypothetical protein [Gammaproteobacteria bacterium]
MKYNHEMPVTDGVTISPGATCWSVCGEVQTGAAMQEIAPGFLKMTRSNMSCDLCIAKGKT